ncbi:ribosome hibernation-promoting factor, HPF/YfiA family [Bdellovibrio sp. HCB337]|uniref:ribosome hibernation-promoting factor, HPF/YfiA family n=1 Tax=Bdellovibrio sp. HCB337 TaxID=3394358 RepID=UPI0039A6AF19
MKLNYTFKHLDHSDSLVQYAEEKMEEIGKFLLKEGYGNVYFSKTKNEFCVEVTVNTREKYFKATSYNMDVYTAVDLVVEKLEKQFLKTRKIMQHHKKPELSREGKIDQLNSRLEFEARTGKKAS